MELGDGDNTYSIPRPCSVNVVNAFSCGPFVSFSTLASKMGGWEIGRGGGRGGTRYQSYSRQQ